MAQGFSDNFTLPKDWQIGLSLSESTSNLMRAEKYADVWFRCKDHDQTVKTDRIAAHKLILACRSPVFEAMFYGEMAEVTEEIAIPEIEKIPFLLFLRYVYTDTADLSEANAIQVLHIAHKYQVTSCVDFCSDVLEKTLRPDNVCCILENAKFLGTKSLESAAIDFIDDNASAVLASEGFQQLRRDTLEYIVKGNTFYAPEVDITEAVDDWAVHNLQTNEMEITPASKRAVLGGVLQHLRWPTLPLRDFVDSQLKYAYLSYEEVMSILKFIAGSAETIQDICMSVEIRIPRKSTDFVEAPGNVAEIQVDQAVSSEVELTCTEEITLNSLSLSLILPTPANAKCSIEPSSDKRKTVIKEAKLKSFGTSCSFTLSPLVSMHPSNSPYKLTVSVDPDPLPAPSSAFNSKQSTGLFGTPTGFSFGSSKPITQRGRHSGSVFGNNSPAFGSSSGGFGQIGVEYRAATPEVETPTTSTFTQTDQACLTKQGAPIGISGSKGKNSFIRGITYTQKNKSIRF